MIQINKDWIENINFYSRFGTPSLLWEGLFCIRPSNNVKDFIINHLKIYKITIKGIFLGLVFIHLNIDNLLDIYAAVDGTQPMPWSKLPCSSLQTMHSLWTLVQW